MKTFYLTLKILFLVSLMNQSSFSQCIADAGADIHRCSPDSSVQLGGSPSAYGGALPYTYAWSINPISTSSQTIPFIFASDVLDDTTNSNPILVYTGSSFIDDSLEFYLTITDNIGCQSFDTVLLTTTHFNGHSGYFEYWINEGDSVYLDQTPNITGGFGEAIYDWNPSYGLSDTNLAMGFWAKPIVSNSYTPTITDSKGCVAVASGPMYFIWMNTTGILENSKSPIKLYPTPTKNVIFIETVNNEPINKVELFSSSGKKLKTELNVTNRIDLSSWPSGKYVLKIYYSEQGVSIQKIIKE